MNGQTVFLLARWTETNSVSCQRILSSYDKNWAFGFMGVEVSWIAGDWVYRDRSSSIDANWHLNSGTMESGTDCFSSFWRDGKVLQLEVPHSSINAGTMQPGRIELNGVSGDRQKSKCEIAEIIMYDRVLQEEELKKVWKYLSGKYKVRTPGN